MTMTLSSSEPHRATPVGGVKPLIYGLTMLIDVVLICVFLSERLDTFDKTFVCCILVSHMFFYSAIHTDNKPLINTLHITLFIALGVGIFLKNRKLIGMCLVILVALNVMWGIFGDCILNRVSKMPVDCFIPIKLYTRLLIVIYTVKLLYPLPVEPSHF